MQLSDVPQRFQKLYARAMSGRSKLASIRAHCLMCMGWEGSVAVKECTMPSCPLFLHRVSAKRLATPKRVKPSGLSAPVTAPERNRTVRRPQRKGRGG